MQAGGERGGERGALPEFLLYSILSRTIFFMYMCVLHEMVFRVHLVDDPMCVCGVHFTVYYLRENRDNKTHNRVIRSQVLVRHRLCPLPYYTTNGLIECTVKYMHVSGVCRE